MSDGSDGEAPLPPEATERELEARQEREEEELEERARAHVEAARAAGGKGKKAKEKIEQAEREAEDWQYNLRERHRAEHERLVRHLSGEGGGSGSEDARAVAGGTADAADADAVVDTATQDDERGLAKKAKAQRKRQGRAAREAEREAEKERERREAGPSARLRESAMLAAQLAKCRPPMRVLEVAADGHCLYRAVGDQLRRIRPDLHRWERLPEQVHDEVRALCAAALRKRMDSYAPFAELKEGEDFEGYCGRVELSGDWGGELELRALADELSAKILVHRAGEPEPLALGECSGPDGAPLQVAFHQHYYALGEHYNSVVPLTGSE